MRIKLESAFLCVDCETISENQRQCDCGSMAVYPVARFLNRRGAAALNTPLPTHTCADRPNLPCDACEGLGVLTK